MMQLSAGMESSHVIPPSRMDTTDTARELDRFLASIERRAFVMAEMATRNRHEALDIVQDAMLALVSRYRDRPAPEWPPLFMRILQNRIMDWHRGRQQRNRLISWFASSGEDDEQDVLSTIADETTDSLPDAMLQRWQDSEALVAAVQSLPLRQQQVFLLRAWQGLDVAETAVAMQVSEGSIKTHYFRAVQQLRVLLGGERDSVAREGSDKSGDKRSGGKHDE